MTANDHHPVPGSPSALTETRATTDGRPRCARAARCEDAQPITTDDGTSYTGGALVHDGSHLCPVCTRYLGYALTGLPLDVAELSLHMAPTLQITYRDPDVPAAPRVKKHAPLPINGRAEALQALIDHETGVWAQAVADADRCRIPCPKCERRALVRERTRGRVVCRCCWRQMSDDDYEQLLAALELI